MISLVFLIVFSGLPVYEIDEIVVTATRYPTALSNIALATMVIDREELDKLHPLSLAEILKHYAGIDIKDYGTTGSVSTIAIRGIQANGVLVLLNGHPLNSVTAGIADLSSVNSNGIERIEIVKGPVSSIYGANALGGVVNIITKKNYKSPELYMKINPSTTEINEPTQTKDFFIQGGLPFGKTNIGIAGGYTASDGYRNNSDLTRYHLQGSFGIENNKIDVDASVIYDNKGYGLPGPKPLVDSMHPIPQFGDSTVTSLFDRQDDNLIFGDIVINWHISDVLSWSNTFFADRKHMRFHTIYADWLGEAITENYSYLTYTLGMNTMAVLNINDTKITFGIDGHYDTLETTKYSEQTGDTVWNASSYNIGAWIECKKTFNRLTFVPSIRLDKNSRFGNFLSPQFGIVGSFMPNLLIKLSVGKAFRAPTFNDLYWPIYGNLDLKPEHGWAYETRFESSLSPNLFAALSLYIRTANDRIFWLPGEDGMWQPQNVNSMNIKGMDIELRGQINDIVTVYLEGTYLDAKQKNNEIVYDYYDWMVDTSLMIIAEIEREAAFTPKYVVSSIINFKLPYVSALGLTGSYVGKRVNYYANYMDDYPNVTMDTKTLDAYFIINTVFSKKLVEVLTLSIGAKNLFNTEYAIQFGNSLDDFDYPMPGRTLFFEFVMDY